jgi:hypothetical protein
MKRYTKTPGTVERAEGHNKWTYSDDTTHKLNSDGRLGYRQCSDDVIADCVARLCKPLSTQAVILKVRAHIAARNLPLPEIIFISPERHPAALMDLAAKVKELADQCANLGSFCVCDPRGDTYLISGVTDE